MNSSSTVTSGGSGVPWYRTLNRDQWYTLYAANLGWFFDGYETYAITNSRSLDSPAFFFSAIFLLLYQVAQIVARSIESTVPEPATFAARASGRDVSLAQAFPSSSASRPNISFQPCSVPLRSSTDSGMECRSVSFVLPPCAAKVTVTKVSGGWPALRP